MIKKLIFVLAFCVPALSLSAQNLPRLGVIGGLNISTLTGVENTVSKTGYTAGLFTKLRIKESAFSIQPELMYTQLGVKTDNSEYDLEYFQVPVLLMYDIELPALPIMPYVFAGPYLGFNMLAEGGGRLSPDISEIVRDNDFGFILGAGIEVFRFTVGARYQFGATQVFENLDFNTGSVDGDERNSAISIVVSFSVN